MNFASKLKKILNLERRPKRRVWCDLLRDRAGVSADDFNYTIAIILLLIKNLPVVWLVHRLLVLVLVWRLVAPSYLVQVTGPGTANRSSALYFSCTSMRSEVARLLPLKRCAESSSLLGIQIFKHWEPYLFRELPVRLQVRYRISEESDFSSK